MFIFDDGVRRPTESKGLIIFKLTISFLLSVALVAYTIYEFYLIYLDGDQLTNNGFGARTFIITEQTIQIPDVVFCVESANNTMSYQCDLVYADGTSKLNGCSNFVKPQKAYPVPSSTTLWCSIFTVNTSLVFDQWNDSPPGLKSLQFTITAQPAPEVVITQLFIPNYNVFAINDLDSSSTDPVTIQAARDQNKYFLSSNTEMFTLFADTVHESLSRSNAASVIGITTSGLTPESFLSSTMVQRAWTPGAAGQYGVLHVQPATYNVLKQRDQRQFSIIFVLGVIGGMFSTLAGFYIILFGARLISPLGLITHLWFLFKQKQPPTDADNGYSDDKRRQSGVLSEAAKNLSTEERLTMLEQILSNYVVNVDSLGKKGLSELV